MSSLGSFFFSRSLSSSFLPLAPHQSLNIPERHEIWSFEKASYRMVPERSTMRFTSLIGEPLCCQPSVYSLTGLSAFLQSEDFMRFVEREAPASTSRLRKFCFFAFRILPALVRISYAILAADCFGCLGGPFFFRLLLSPCPLLFPHLHSYPFSSLPLPLLPCPFRLKARSHTLYAPGPSMQHIAT